MEKAHSHPFDIPCDIICSHMHAGKDTGQHVEEDSRYRTDMCKHILRILQQEDTIRHYPSISAWSWHHQWIDGRFFRHARPSCCIIFHIFRTRQGTLYGYDTDLRRSHQHHNARRACIQRLCHPSCRQFIYILAHRPGNRSDCRKLGLQAYSEQTVHLYRLRIYRRQRPHHPSDCIKITADWTDYVDRQRS